MKLENKHGIVEYIRRALADDEYTRGDASISVSELIRPPRIRILTKLHEDEIVEDVIARIPSFVGKAIHKAVEEAGNRLRKRGETTPETQEERIYQTVHGIKVGGQFDCYIENESHLRDIKTTTAGKIIWGEYLEWERQLNCYAYLLSLYGKKVDKITVDAWILDWKEKEVLKNPEYPKLRLIEIPLRVAPIEQIRDYFEQRVLLHKTAEESGVLPPCTDKERWKGNMLCKKYCTVSQWCDQYKELLLDMQ